MAKQKGQSEPQRARSVRCGIYTRKSTEEGLEQEFNSLDAQYEACAAYVLSQKHEGWTLCRERYDDGGFSGGNMERPGLKRLLAAVEARQIDVILVYKVDRLTRSLADFAKIVEVLDARGASFVSITQAFNTTTSMGRLTLNVLLSFAQFEREVTGERIRDKIAASKAKGIWMGGAVPMGYRLQDRRLLVEQAEAATVRHIFERYLALGSGRALLDELRQDGIRTCVRGSKGGIFFQRGPLFHLLGNRFYLGEVNHKGVTYPGEHAGIVQPELFDAVQAAIVHNRVERSTRSNARESSLLAGLIRDSHGRRMSPSHASKGSRRYRYYITHSAELLTGSAPGERVPAHDVEKIVLHRLSAFLHDRKALYELGQLAGAGAAATAEAERVSRTMVDQLQEPGARAELLRNLIEEVQLAEDHVALRLSTPALVQRIGLGADIDAPGQTLIAPAVRTRQGKEVRLIITDGQSQSSERNEKVVDLLRQAQAAREAILSRPDSSLRVMANELACCRYRLMKLLRLSFLAPPIVDQLLAGSHPPTLTGRVLLEAELPLAWSDQQKMLLA